MKTDRKKLELAMARACIDGKELAAAAGVSLSAIRSLRIGAEIRPSTLGKVACALGVDPVEIIDPEDLK